MDRLASLLSLGGFAAAAPRRFFWPAALGISCFGRPFHLNLLSCPVPAGTVTATGPAGDAGQGCGGPEVHTNSRAAISMHALHEREVQSIVGHAGKKFWGHVTARNPYQMSLGARNFTGSCENDM